MHDGHMHASMLLRVRGRVQGVGFRPYAYGLAREHGLTGSVRNIAGAVRIEIAGPKASVERFVRELPARAPALAHIESMEIEALEPTHPGDAFRILPSIQASSEAEPVLAPDTATCDACLAELSSVGSRHFAYPLVSCSQCGPRLTVVRALPWDRRGTTLRDFPLCMACQAEYDDPEDRRFHAESIACAACGPRLDGASIDALAKAVREGAVGALKGLGGYHLVCDASRPTAVRRLRERKHRPHEPFAIMLRDMAAVERRAVLTDVERRLLESATRPIVLCALRGASDLAPEVAPSLDRVGVMLPYTGLHALLFDALPDIPLVMTSANRHGAPMVYREEDREQLAPLCDVVVSHTRPIANRCDDSVLRADEGGSVPLRLGRGFAPLPVALPGRLREVTLASGGHLKAAFALGHGGQATLGPHVGDLEDYDNERSYVELLDRLGALHGLEPRRAVIDAHPDYATRRICTRRGLSLIEVHHHHAHMAACMAEHGLTGEALGVVFDGSGLGPDGTLWGGELLAGDYAAVQRVGHLRSIGLAGGERAIREPWRVALAYLRDAGLCPDAWLEAIPSGRREAVSALLDARAGCPHTSSVGRLFDAVAFLCGLVVEPTFDAHGPMWLEAAAARCPSLEVEGYPVEVKSEGTRPLCLDPRSMWAPLLEDVRAGRDTAWVAARFHRGLSEATVRATGLAARRTGLSRVVLSGGVFVNRILARAVREGLCALGLSVYEHRVVPPNDGGLALGQLAICAAHDAEEGR